MESFEYYLEEYLKHSIMCHKHIRHRIVKEDFLDKYSTRNINKLIINSEQITNEGYKYILNSSEIMQRQYLQKLFFANIENHNDLELTSLLFHILSNTKLKESKFYIFRILPRIHNELSYWLVLKYSNIKYPNITSMDNITSGLFNYHFNFSEFRTPHYADLTEKLLLKRMNEDDKFTIIEDTLNCGFVYDCIHYLIYCFYENSIEISTLRKILGECLRKTLNVGFFCMSIASLRDFLLIQEAVINLIPKINHLLEIRPFKQINDCTNKRDENANAYNLSRQLEENNDNNLRTQYVIPIYGEFIRGLKCLIQTLGVVENKYEEGELLFQMIENIDFSSKREKEIILNHIKKSRFKQQRLYNKKFDKQYINPIKTNTFDSYTDILDAIIHFRRWDLPAWSEKHFINNYVENEVREELGLLKVGEGWRNETFLYYVIKNLLADKGITVFHHYRPKFLARQELDIYFELGDRKVGIEYQGLQHFQAVEYFGGEEAFKLNQKRDLMKMQKCTENNVRIIYFTYLDNLDHDLIKQRFQKNGITI